MSPLSALGCADDQSQLSRLHKSLLALRRPDNRGSLPGADLRRDCCVAVERLLEREDVPGGDQDFARYRGLRGGWPCRAGVRLCVEAVPWRGPSPGVLGDLDRGPSQGGRSGLEDRPVQELSPACLIVGASPRPGPPTLGEQLLSAHPTCAVRRVTIAAGEQNEVFRAASFRIVSRRQKPAFGVSPLLRHVRSGSDRRRSVGRHPRVGIAHPGGRRHRARLPQP